MMNGMQRLVQAERDNTDLHGALAEAIKRLYACRTALLRAKVPQAYELSNMADLFTVLDRTSHPAEPEFTDLTPQQACKLIDLVEREAVEQLADAIDRHGPEYA